MTKNRTVAAVFTALLAVLACTETGEAGTQDNAVIALHAEILGKNAALYCPTSKSPTLPCTDYVTDWPLSSTVTVFLVVARGNPDVGIQGFSCGVDYDSVAASGVDVASWYPCSDLLGYPSGNWPDAGGGIRMTWSPSTGCQSNVLGNEGVHAVAGYFVVSAYSDDVFRVTPNPNILSGPEFVVTDCNVETSTLRYPEAAGRISFTNTPSTAPGYTPCCDLVVHGINDVGSDQGRRVRIDFCRSTFDYTLSPTPIVQYEAFRRIDPLPSAPGVSPLAADYQQRVRDARERGMVSSAAVLAGWEFVTAVPAHGDYEYSMLAETLSDSTISLGQYWSNFFIRAATASPTVFYDSTPDSGYSVDNLSPESVVSPFINPIGELSWTPSPSPDVDHFTVYGSAMDVLDGTAVSLGTTKGNTFDVSATPYHFYHITATDFSGNEGASAIPIAEAATPAGTNVAVPLDPSVTLTFDDVTSPGTSQLTKSSSGTATPVGIEVVPSSPGVYYDLSTTAAFTGNVEICIVYDQSEVVGPESGLMIMHYDTALMSWFDVTTSLDTATNTICGKTTSLSPFVLVEPGSPSGIDPHPSRPRLYASFPNPFSTRTRLAFELPEAGHVRLEIFDANGRRVRTLIDEYMAAGLRGTFWNGRDDSGDPVASGLYFYSLRSGNWRKTARVVFIR